MRARNASTDANGCERAPSSSTGVCRPQVGPPQTWQRGALVLQGGVPLGAVLQCCDLLGNACDRGGARLRCVATPRPVRFEVVDHDDGSYGLEWLPLHAWHSISIRVNGEALLGSPFHFDPSGVQVATEDERSDAPRPWPSPSP